MDIVALISHIIFAIIIIIDQLLFFHVPGADSCFELAGA